MSQTQHQPQHAAGLELARLEPSRRAISEREAKERERVKREVAEYLKSGLKANLWLLKLVPEDWQPEAADVVIDGVTYAYELTKITPFGYFGELRLYMPCPKCMGMVRCIKTNPTIQQVVKAVEAWHAGGTPRYEWWTQIHVCEEIRIPVDTIGNSERLVD